MTVDTLDRVLGRCVETEAGCWEYTGMIHDGYGVLGATPAEGTRRVHRIVWIRLRGPVPDGLVLDHLCRNRACCNPEHMEPVPQGENIRRGMTGAAASARHAKRTHCARGHAFTEGNTYRRQDGRRCRTCSLERRRRERLDGPAARHEGES